MPVNEPGAESWEAISQDWAGYMARGDGPGQSRKLLLDSAHLDVLGDVSGKRILDVGCGEGRFARMLTERGAKVTALDLSHGMITIARGIEAESPLGIDYIEGSMTDMHMLTDASFDVAVAYLSTIDVMEFEKAYGEIARVLKLGGQFLSSEVHPCFNPPGAHWQPRKEGTIPIWDKDKLYKKIDNYFPSREVRFKMWPTAPVETINYHRTLTDNTAALARNGFVICRIVEPVPTEEVMAQRDDQREHTRAPFFILFDCVKA